MDFEKYVPDTARNDIIIQAALKDIDYGVLSTALIGLPDVSRQCFYRNVARKTAEVLRNDVKRLESATGDEKIRSAVDLLGALLAKHDELTGEIDERLAREARCAKPPEIRLETKDEVLATFISLSDFVNKAGLLALEDVTETIDNQLASKGIEMIVGGYDPPEMLSILERLKQTLVRSIEERFSMIIDGIESLQAGDHPRFVASKLEAYLAE